MTAVRMQQEETDLLASEMPAPDLEFLRETAQVLARAEVSDAVTRALNQYGGSLRDLQRESGLDPAFVSRLARGQNQQGGTVASLAQIALALDKTLRITIE